MRTDISHHLKECGLNLDEVAFYQDDVLPQEVESVALVDFNCMNDEVAHLADKVHHIFDHHVDNNLYQETVKTRNIVVPLGSAVTLVIPQLFELIQKDDTLSQFVSAPMTLDTDNFSEKLKGIKWVDQD